MKTEYEYISFNEVDNPGKKTSVWCCLNKRSETVLGYIRWYSAWRQYCYFPALATLYSQGCLKDIIDFINQLMEERKKNKDEHGNIK